MKLEGLGNVGMIANRRVTDSEIRQRQRILDAKRRMAERNKVQDNEEKNEEPNASINNRISDSARNRQLMRGAEARRAATAQTRTQDSRAKSYFALRKRIKDELEETESTEEAIEAAVNVLQEEATAAPEDVLAAVVEVLSDVVDTMPASEASEELPAEEDNYDEYDETEDEEVADSLRRRQLIRRNVVADARERAMLRKRDKSAITDSRKRVEERKRVLDALARKRAAAKRIRDAREHRESAMGAKNRMMR